MTIKIEKKSVLSVGGYRDLTHIYQALKDMKVGESFLQERQQTANIRMVLTACRTLIGSHFAVRKEGDKYRIGRVK